MKRRSIRAVARRSRTVEPPPESDAEIAVLERPAEMADRRIVGIRVELDSTIAAWPAQSRLDVVLRGRIVSAAPVNSFSIRDPAGQELVVIQFGHRDEPDEVKL